MPSLSVPTLILLGSAGTAGCVAGAMAIAIWAHRPGFTVLAWSVALCAVLGVALAWALQRLALRVLGRQLAAQADENLRFDTVINNISQGVCFFDGQQRLIVCNRRYAEMYRLSMAQIPPGTRLHDIVDLRFAAGTCPAMSKQEYLEWRNAIAVSNTPSDTVATLNDGRTFAIHHQPMPDGGWVATHEDITERRRNLAQIEHMARNDALTGLANRVQFRDRLNQLVLQGPALGAVAVLSIDLDRFKAVNDTLGHPVGDQLLREAAARLERTVREGDLVARLGGDEFAIIQHGAAQPAAARALAQRLVRDFAEPFVVGEHKAQIGSSIGIALSPDDGTHPDDLLKKADLALYDAKAAGRGTYRRFHPQLVEQAQARSALEADLRLALQRGELHLHYQPIVAIGSRRIVAFEALLRWQHPKRGWVMPDSFIPLAEETGLIESLGTWVLHEAFAQAARWPADVAIAVNLSPLQIRSERLQEVVRTALEASGLAAGRVELEITESVRLAEDSANLARLHALQQLGVRICLDDFGVGYSSLSYLRSFPFKKIKIDRSFVRDVAGNAQAAAIVRAITMLGASLGMRITAEGVEHAHQMPCLHELGCDEAQGYWLGRPAPAPCFEAELAAQGDAAGAAAEVLA